MIEKVIYDNGSSRVTVSFDGEIVTIKQQLEDFPAEEINIYVPELDDIVKFIKENKQ
jgi:hypothetical protein